MKNIHRSPSTLSSQPEKLLEVKLDWRIVTKNIDKPLIIDVVIEGVRFGQSTKGRI